MNRLIKHSHWLIYILGIIIALWSAKYVDEQIRKNAQHRFDAKVQNMESAITRGIRSYEDILYGMAGLYQTTDAVTPEQFDQYIASLDTKKRFPALVTTNFAQYVPIDSQSAFSRNFSADTGGRNSTAKLVLPDEDSMVITRINPPSLFPSIGVDVFQSITRLLPTAKAGDPTIDRDSYLPNKILSSGMLIRPPKKKKFTSIAARLAVYKKGETSQQNLYGTVGIGFNIATFFREIVPKSSEESAHFRLLNIGRTDGPRYNPPSLLFDSLIGDNRNIDTLTSNSVGTLKKHFDIPFGGALLRVEVFAPIDSFIDHDKKYLPFIVLAIGLLFIGYIGFSTRRMLSANAVLDDAVKKRTIELQCEVNKTKSLELEIAAITNLERAHIGRELHDDLGQRLTVISVSAELLFRDLSKIDQQLSEKADALGRAASEAMEQVRKLAHELVPVAPDKAGLRNALLYMADSITNLSHIKCKFNLHSRVDLGDEHVSAHLFRIAQEAVNNSIRHAGATAIEIELRCSNGKVAMKVSDNGCGFNMEGGNKSDGLGLSIIAQRASIINYALEVASSSKGGTIIEVTEC